jgi:pyrroline-5-carboxylate reductase
MVALRVSHATWIANWQFSIPVLQFAIAAGADCKLQSTNCKVQIEDSISAESRWAPSMLTQSIGFIGAGQMAKALAGGFVAAQLVEARQVVAFDPVAAAAESFVAKVSGATLASDNAGVARQADVVFLAVKPQNMPAAMQQLAGHVTPAKIFVSIAAGATLAKLEAGLGTGRVIRVMPNTPALVGQGASAYALGSGATPDDGKLVGQLLAAVGQAHLVEEKLLDAVTGLSGSGPAFVYLVIEALTDGGVQMGLPRDVAAALAAQTVRGAGTMVVETHQHPAVLRDQVTSPGGTTIAGLAALEQRGLRSALIAAVEAATRRSQELGK